MDEKLDARAILQSIIALRDSIREQFVAQAKGLDELRAAQAKTDAQLAKTDAQLAKGFEELRASQAKTDAQLAKTDAQLAKGFEELRASQARTDAQLAKTDAQLARTDAKLDRIGQQLADIGFSNGDAAEDFFFSSLEADKRLGKIHFENIERNVHKKKKRLEEEYDILLTNGDSVALVEVKHKVQSQHITTLATRKIDNFRVLFPDYAHYKIYAAIAGMSYDLRAEEFAHQEGVIVLKQQGDHLEVNTEGMKAF